MRRSLMAAAALCVAFTLAAPMSVWASVPRVIMAEGFGYPG
jgi:hypothetical protein